MKLLLPLGALLLWCHCATSTRLLALSPELANKGPVTQAAILQLNGSAYPARHNVAAVQNLNLPVLAEKALEDALARKRKKWKIVLPSNVSKTEPLLLDCFAQRKDSFRDVSDSDKTLMSKTAGILDTRYFFVLENISVKDVSTPQAPANLIVGASLQMWDFKNGTLVYRVRDTSRPVSYRETDFKSRLETVMTDLFIDLISPLPKN